MTTFATIKKNPNIRIINHPSTHAPLSEHNHFGRKISGTISSTMHFKNCCSFDNDFSKETQNHKRKTLAKKM
jgi:hypothetical protein